MLLASAATPAAAQTYVRAGVGVAVDYPTEIVYPRKGWEATFTRDGEGPAINAAVGYDFGAIRLELNGTGAAFAAGRAGSPNGNPGFDGKPSSPEGRRDGTQVAIAGALAMLDLPLSSKTTFSIGGGPNVSRIFADTSYASPENNEGWLEGSDGKWRIGSTVAAELNHRVGQRTLVGIRGSYEMLGRHEMQMQAESGTVVSRVHEKLRLPTVMATLTYSFGGE